MFLLEQYLQIQRIHRKNRLVFLSERSELGKLKIYKKQQTFCCFMDYYKESLKLHEQKKGKIAISLKVPLKTRDDLSLAYTPGVAEPCREIAKNKENAYKYTFKGNTVAVISDGSSVLGLGNIGAEAALPV